MLEAVPYTLATFFNSKNIENAVSIVQVDLGFLFCWQKLKISKSSYFHDFARTGTVAYFLFEPGTWYIRRRVNSSFPDQLTTTSLTDASNSS